MVIHWRDLLLGTNPETASAETLGRPSAPQPLRPSAPELRPTDAYIAGLGSNFASLAHSLQNSDARSAAEAAFHWFDQGEQADNHNAYQTALALQFIAFSRSSSTSEQTQCLERYHLLSQNYSALMNREQNPLKLARGITRLSVLASYMLRETQNSNLSSEEIERNSQIISQNMRTFYAQVAQNLSARPRLEHLRDFAQARALILNPPTATASSGVQLDWLREIRNHLTQAQRLVSANDPHPRYQASTIRTLVERDLATLPPNPEARLSQGFITLQSASFVCMIAQEIDMENGDSESVAERRYNQLLPQIQNNLQQDPNEKFNSPFLGRLNTPESWHLRALIQNSQVLRELIQEAEQNAPDPSDVSATVSDWERRVIQILHGHLHRNIQQVLHLRSNEVHLGSYRAILNFFASPGSSAAQPTGFERALFELTGLRPDSNQTRSAARHLADTQSFGFEAMQGLERFASLENFAFIAGTALLNRMLASAFIRGAGESGNVWRWVRGGELTAWGHIGVGTLAGSLISLFASTYQAHIDRTHGNEGHFFRNLGLGILINSTALGLGAALAAPVRRMTSLGNARLLGEAMDAGRWERIGRATLRGFRAGLGRSLFPTLSASGSFMATQALVRGLHNYRLPAHQQVPLLSWDEGIETSLTMLGMVSFENILLNVGPRYQLGPYRERALTRWIEENILTDIPAQNRNASIDGTVLSRARDILRPYLLRGLMVPHLGTRSNPGELSEFLRYLRDESQTDLGIENFVTAVQEPSILLTRSRPVPPPPSTPSREPLPIYERNDPALARFAIRISLPQGRIAVLEDLPEGQTISLNHRNIPDLIPEGHWIALRHRRGNYTLEMQGPSFNSGERSISGNDQNYSLNDIIFRVQVLAPPDPLESTTVEILSPTLINPSPAGPHEIQMAEGRAILRDLIQELPENHPLADMIIRRLPEGVYRVNLYDVPQGLRVEDPQSSLHSPINGQYHQIFNEGEELRFILEEGQNIRLRFVAPPSERSTVVSPPSPELLNESARTTNPPAHSVGVATRPLNAATAVLVTHFINDLKPLIERGAEEIFIYYNLPPHVGYEAKSIPYENDQGLIARIRRGKNGTFTSEFSPVISDQARTAIERALRSRSLQGGRR